MDSLETWLVPIFGIVFTFGVPGVVLLRFFDVRNKERLALIDKGATLEDLKVLLKNNANGTRNNLNNLRFGLLALFIGIGIFSGIQLSVVFNWPDEFIPAFILISGGAALILYYFIVLRLERKKVAEQ